MSECPGCGQMQEMPRPYSCPRAHYVPSQTTTLEPVRPIILDLKPGGFVVKAGGGQTAGAGGMVRSSAEGKVDYTLALDGVMFNRWAEHLDRATKPRGDFPGYAKRNWMLATGGTPEERQAVIDRAKVSAFRHLLQWLRGEADEDHAAAVIFNLNLVETVKESLR